MPPSSRYGFRAFFSLARCFVAARTTRRRLPNKGRAIAGTHQTATLGLEPVAALSPLDGSMARGCSFDGSTAPEGPATPSSPLARRAARMLG